MKNFKKTVIAQHIKRTSVSQAEADQRWEGLCMFLTLCAQTKRKEVASEPVDELWHDVLLFTEDYRKFSKKHCGVVNEHMPATVPGKPSGYLVSREKMVKQFGPLQTSVWPRSERLLEWSIGYVSKEK